MSNWPPESVTLAVNGYVVVWQDVGVPEICPELELSDRPGGKSPSDDTPCIRRHAADSRERLAIRTVLYRHQGALSS